MNARERLVWELRNPGLVGYSEEDATEFVDAFAHQLAETIRASRDETRGAVQATKVMDFAADLIDPSAGPVRPDEEPVPHDEDECRWEEGCRCLCSECQGRPDEEPTP